MSGSTGEPGIVHTVASASSFRSWAATHCGTVRQNNQDGFVNRPDLGVWAVADGAGGHQAGEVASTHVLQALETMPPGLSAAEVLLEVRQRLAAAHEWLRAEGARRGEGAVVATTVVVLLARDEHFACLWAGDSRAYLLRAGKLVQISRDHSLVQDLVDSGALAPAEAEGHPHANVITRALGADMPELELDKRSGTLLPGDRLLMCSDGLFKALTEDAIAELLGADEDALAERLILAALTAQATDNVTAVAIQVVPVGDGAMISENP